MLVKSFKAERVKILDVGYHVLYRIQNGFVVDIAVGGYDVVGAYYRLLQVSDGKLRSKYSKRAAYRYHKQDYAYYHSKHKGQRAS